MIRLTIFILIIIFSSLQANAQLSGQAKIDSLESELPNAKQDTNHVKLLNDLSFAYRGANPDKGIEYGEKGLQLAVKLDWEKGKASLYNSLGTNYHVKSDYSKAIEYYGKALKINEEIENKNGIARNLGNMGLVYMNQSDYPKAIEYYGKALKINEEIGNKNGVAVNLGNMAIFYHDQSDYPKALEYYGKALKIYEEIGNKNGVAKNLVNMGIVYYLQSDYPKALEYYGKALKINEEIGNKNGVAANLGNMGLVYHLQSDYPKALEYYGKALKIYEEIGNKNGVAANLGNIGSLYEGQSDYPKALEYYGKALKINEEIGNKNGVAANLGNMGVIYEEQSDYPKALEYYGKALKINEEIGNKNSVAANLGNMGFVYMNQSDYPKALEYYGKALKINEEIGNKNGVAANLGNMGELYLILSQDSVNIKPDESNGPINLNKHINLNKAIEFSQKAIKMFKEIGELDRRSENLKILAEAYKLKGNYKKAYDAHVEYKKLQDSIFNIEKEKNIATLTATREKEVAEKELEIQKLENIKQRNESYVLYGGLAAFSVVLFIIFRQRKRSEELLLNILPATIAKRLKKKENPIADHFDNASIVFIDIVGFTSMSSDTDADLIVQMLDKIFKQFDEIADKYNLEKIKTIGDSYMAVAGVPIPDSNHAKNMANFALEVMQNMTDYRTENDTLIQFRIGIASGDIVAGVIGTNKFIYDLWGDTVNIASRMESTGTPGKIQVTEQFKESLDNEFSFEERGEIKVKGKGNMKTYYLEGKN